MNRKKTDMMVKGAMVASLFGALGVINVYTGTMFDIIFSYVMVVFIVWVYSEIRLSLRIVSDIVYGCHFIFSRRFIFYILFYFNFYYWVYFMVMV